MAEQRMRSYEMTEIGKRGLDDCLDEAYEVPLDDCDGVFLSVDVDVCDPDMRRARAPRTREGFRRDNCWTRFAESAWSFLSWAWTS